MGLTYSRADAATSPSSAAAEALSSAAPSSSPTPPSPSSTPAPSSSFSAALSAATGTSKSTGAGLSSTKPWWRGFERSELPNPGSYEEMMQDTMQILRPNLVEGLSFNFNAPMSDMFSLGSTFELGAKDRPGLFAFNANYFTPRLVMISRTTPADGRVNGRVFINHTPALTSKINADVGPKPAVATQPGMDGNKGSWDLDYRGSDFAANFKLASPGIVAVSYLQSVTPWLALGGEGFYQSMAEFSALTAAVKYSWEKDLMTLSMASYGPIIASYVRKVNPKVSFATECIVDARNMESHVTVGYRFEFKNATVVGNVDSGGRIAATLEERINPALSLTLSGELDHSKEDYKFGFGVNIGGG